MHNNTPRTLHSAALHSYAWHAPGATESLHRRLLRRVAAAGRSCLACYLAWLRHVHGRTCVCACDVRARGSRVWAGVWDVRATTVAELGVRRAGRLVLSLRLWALLLLLLRWLLQAHLLHLALAHQLSVVVLVVGRGTSSGHVSVLLRCDLLLLLLLLDVLLWRLLLGKLLLLLLVRCALLIVAGIPVSTIA
jgi:hypothetical protein